ncbi:transcriptional regulator [Rouxiella silvae]|uniref:Transcriptional regulator n=1 Tax=Rouxiella silvae TaxID=1646373 RepID=A0AA40X627_9GAMM|nr:MurR/RpiR family transcriptional regulator [Rouxiella silvae]MBF6639248.1 MurR/RpiR family transcriptional regulator [Rouxiella silvae]ORJ23027.1 transcriptional regulator [Rouxiella silvae]
MSEEKIKNGKAGEFSNVLDRLGAVRKDLPPTAGRIADFISQHAADVMHMSITELAERTGSSEGSVIGLCQTIGARGFQQVKLSLARELVQPVHFIHEDLTPSDNTAQVIDKIFQSDMQALRDTQSALSVEALAEAVKAIRQAKRVEVFGIGSAATIAEDTHYRLLRIGIPSRVSVDSHVQAIAASLADAQTAVITISHSGSTVETLTATQLAKEAGATTIAVTNFGRSPLLAYSDIVLNTLARETQFRSEAMTSRIAQLAVIDALIACLALSDYDRSVQTLAKTFDVLGSKRI